MSTLLADQRKNNQKGMKTSLLVHSMMLLLAFFIGCPYEPDISKNQYAVVVDFEKPEFVEFTNSTSSNSTKSQSSSGAPKKKADPVTEIKKPKTEHVPVERPQVKVKLPTPTPKPTTPIISETTSEEETEIEAVEEEIEMEDPEPDPIPDPVPDPEPEPDPAPPAADKPIISVLKDILVGTGKEKTSPNENPGTKPSKTDGDGSGKGNSGSGKGNNTSGDDGDSGKGTGGSGSGDYDASGDGVFGRKVIHRNYKEILAVEFGNQAGKKITAKFCVNRDGVVTYAELLDDETTAIIPNGREGRKQVLKGIYGYKVEKDLAAAAEQCGKLKIILSEINTFR